MKPVKNPISVGTKVYFVDGSYIDSGVVVSVNKVTYTIAEDTRHTNIKIKHNKVCHQDDVTYLARDANTASHYYDYKNVWWGYDDERRATTVHQYAKKRIYNIRQSENFIKTYNNGKITVTSRKVNGTSSHVVIFVGLNIAATYSINHYMRKIKFMNSYSSNNPIRNLSLVNKFRPEKFVYHDTNLTEYLKMFLSKYSPLVIDSRIMC